MKPLISPAASLPWVVAVALRDSIDSDPVVHVLVQMPLLVLSGYVAAGFWRINPAHVLSVFLIALTGFIFWMLPRSVDFAATSGIGEIVKYVTLPVLVGMPLRLSWQHLHPMVRGFFKANCLSMLGVLGYLYLHAPIRICNSYLVSAQERLGFGFLYLCAGLCVLWAWPVLFGRIPFPTLPIFRTPSRSV